MTVAYAPRITVHPDRYGNRKSGRNRLFVLHTSEGGEGEQSAENLAAYMASKGDRRQRDGTFYGSSYQYILDTDRVIPAVSEDVVSYSASGANHDGIHIVFPGRARQTRAEWLDPISSAYIDRCAELLVDRSPATGIPLDRIDAAAVVAGRAGLCDHATITAAYGRTDHTDVGPSFPWDVLGVRIARLSQPDPTPPPPLPSPPSEVDAVPARIFRNEATGHMALVFLGDAGTRMYGLPAPDVERIRTAYDAGADVRVSNELWNDVRVKALISMGYDPDTGRPRAV